METFLIWFGAFASLLTVLGTVYGVGKWLVARFRKADGSLPPAVVVMSRITTGLERTVVVPSIVEKTLETVEKVVVPIILPNVPPRPSGVPEWLEPTGPKPWVRPEIPAETRPDKRPRTTRPPVHGYTHREADMDFTTRLVGSKVVSTSRGSPLGGNGQGGVDRSSTGGSHRGDVGGSNRGGPGTSGSPSR